MKKLTDKKSLILYGCSGLGVNMLNIIVGSYLCSALLVGGFKEHIESWTYLNKNLVVAGLWAVLIFFAKALDGVIDLPLATFADKLNTRFGRRKTAMLIGIVPMLVAYVLFLVPLNNEATILNTVWFGCLLCIFYTCYTLTMLTYYATFSEVCETEKDTVCLSNTKSICDVVYFSLSFALVPIFIGFGINIRLVALIFLPLVLTMVIPFILLKEDGEYAPTEKPLSLVRSISVSLKNRTYIYWLLTVSIMTVGTQLFLGGINEVFSTTGLNMTVVMASSFAPVPLTLILYNKVIKRFGLGVAYRYCLAVFSVGMLVMYGCCIFSDALTALQLMLIALFGGILVSFAIGAFFSITYTVPSYLARKELQDSGNNVSAMYFAVQGLFEGIAAGIATGLILVTLKDYNCIQWLPIIVAVCCMTAFAMTFGFKDHLAYMDKQVENK
ncbi:MAG: MFS transporter [Clostridia bacterium]|nr:MFS transporter [Clostridia bacterium]